MIEEIKNEIACQIESMKYLQRRPDIAIKTISQETPEYCRGALAMLNYLQVWIEHNEEELNDTRTNPS